MKEIKQRYKEHVWKLEFTGDPQSFKSAIQGKYELLNLGKDDNMYVARVKIAAQVTPNDLLASVMPGCIIHGFSETLPSMSEIFISAVKGERCV